MLSSCCLCCPHVASLVCHVCKRCRSLMLVVAYCTALHGFACVCACACGLCSWPWLRALVWPQPLPGVLESASTSYASHMGLYAGTCYVMSPSRVVGTPRCTIYPLPVTLSPVGSFLGISRGFESPAVHERVGTCELRWRRRSPLKCHGIVRLVDPC